MSRSNQTTTLPSAPQIPQPLPQIPSSETPTTPEAPSTDAASMAACGENCAAWNMEASLSHLRTNSLPPYGNGQCAKFVRKAIEAGGVPINRSLNSTPGGIQSAKGYGPILTDACFGALPPGAEPQAGDVAVFPAIPGHSHGHISMFDGTDWYSDFKQNDIYAGSAYRNTNAPYTIYRRCSNP